MRMGKNKFNVNINEPNCITNNIATLWGGRVGITNPSNF